MIVFSTTSFTMSWNPLKKIIHSFILIAAIPIPNINAINIADIMSNKGGIAISKKMVLAGFLLDY